MDADEIYAEDVNWRATAGELQREVTRLANELRLLKVRSEYTERNHQQLCKALEPLCPCDYNPETTDGPQQDCPLHGDGITFVGQHRALQSENIELRRELEARRATVTTGGPGVPFTETWENGPNSRPPTAPPEPVVVQLPTPDKGATKCNCGGVLSHAENCPEWVLPH